MGFLGEAEAPKQKCLHYWLYVDSLAEHDRQLCHTAHVSSRLHAALAAMVPRLCARESWRREAAGARSNA